MGKKRIEWIDIARGIGICLMSFGHLYDSSGQSPWFPKLGGLLAAIYLFHMELFFILAGCTFNGGRPFKQFVLRKARTLLVPYIVFSPYYLARPLAVALWPSLASAFGNRGGATLAEQAINVFVYGNGLWFLMALFFAEIYVWALSRLMGERRGLWLTCGIVLIALYQAELGAGAWEGFQHVPFQLARALQAAGFMCVGIALKGWLMSLKRPAAAALGAACAAAFLPIAAFLVADSPDAWQAWAPYAVAALLGSLACIGLSIAIAGARTRGLAWIGRESLTFYAVQALCINLAKLILFSGLGLDFSGAPFAVQLAGGLACTALAMALMAPCDLAVRRWIPWAIGAPRRRAGV